MYSFDCPVILKMRFSNLHSLTKRYASLLFFITRFQKFLGNMNFEMVIIIVIFCVRLGKIIVARGTLKFKVLCGGVA